MDNLNYDSEQLSEDQQNQMLFMMLVQQHQQIAMMGMGKIKNPATDEIERDYLNETLNNLRLNYAEEAEGEDIENEDDDNSSSEDESGS